jgi:hypothetical protein
MKATGRWFSSSIHTRRKATGGGSGRGGGCFGLRKTVIGEWATMGRKTGGYDESC